jgi:hypothetical protein
MAARKGKRMPVRLCVCRLVPPVSSRASKTRRSITIVLTGPTRAWGTLPARIRVGALIGPWGDREAGASPRLRAGQDPWGEIKPVMPPRRGSPLTMAQFDRAQAGAVPIPGTNQTLIDSGA